MQTKIFSIYYNFFILFLLFTTMLLDETHIKTYFSETISTYYSQFHIHECLLYVIFCLSRLYFTKGQHLGRTLLTGIIVVLISLLLGQVFAYLFRNPY
jgi:ABC-type spermidine/putrescine transport system permease subunit I